MSRALPSEFGVLPSGYASSFTSAVSPEQTARVIILRNVVETVGDSVSADGIVEIARYVETGLRSYDDPPAVDTAEGTDPDVIDAEKIRTAVETALQREGEITPNRERLAAEVVGLIYPETKEVPW